MLTGQRAFEGEDISVTLASVIKEEVSWPALPADLPEPVRRLLRRCLEKDPKRRLRDIGEARLTLEDPASSEPRRQRGRSRRASRPRPHHSGAALCRSPQPPSSSAPPQAT